MSNHYRILPTINNVELISGRVFFSTLFEENITYAFYLYHVYHQDRVEKQVYKKDNTHFFNMEVIDGLYRGVFFRKGQSIYSSYDEQYFLIKDNEVQDVNCFVVREDAGFIITNYDIGSDITFIVFQVTGSNKKTAPFGLEFLLLQGVNVIACNQNNNHYQDLSFEHFQELLNPFLIDKKVFLYGSSLAGYCAIYYSGAVNGKAIAAAPRLSIHPEMQRIFPDISYKGEYRHNDISYNSKSKYEPVIFIDPMQERDLFFLNNYIKPLYKDAMVLEFEYAGHEVLTHIMKTKQLTNILRKIIIGRESELIKSIDFNINTEFSVFEKTLGSINKLNNFLDELFFIKNKHASIQKKMPILKNKVEKILKKLDSFE